MNLDEAIYQALNQDMRDKVDEIQAEARQLEAEEERRYKEKCRAHREKNKREAEKCLNVTRIMVCFLFLLSLGISLLSYLTDNETIATCCVISWLFCAFLMCVFIMVQVDYNEK